MKFPKWRATSSQNSITFLFDLFAIYRIVIIDQYPNLDTHLEVRDRPWNWEWRLVKHMSQFSHQIFLIAIVIAAFDGETKIIRSDNFCAATESSCQTENATAQIYCTEIYYSSSY